MAENLSLEASPARQPAIGLGFWAAILATVFSIAFVVLALAFPPEEWNGIARYADSFDFLQMANFIPVFLLAPTVIALMASIHTLAAEKKRVFSLLGIALSCVYAAIICTNYYIQLFAVRLTLLTEPSDALALLAMPNLHSVFFALEALGYSFLSLACVSISRVFSGGVLEAWIRWLLIATGAVGVFGLIVAPLDKPLLIVAGLGIWSLTFPASTLLIGVLFRRTQKQSLAER